MRVIESEDVARMQLVYAYPELGNIIPEEAMVKCNRDTRWAAALAMLL
jgi:hypothetical protein